jgi:hypothetical protein
MKCLTVILIFCHLVLLFEPALASQYQQQQFISGYKEKVKSKRKKSFNTGALTGTLVIVAAILLSAGSYE